MPKLGGDGGQHGYYGMAQEVFQLKGGNKKWHDVKSAAMSITKALSSL